AVAHLRHRQEPAVLAAAEGHAGEGPAALDVLAEDGGHPGAHAADLQRIIGARHHPLVLAVEAAAHEILEELTELFQRVGHCGAPPSAVWPTCSPAGGPRALLLKAKLWESLASCRVVRPARTYQPPARARPTPLTRTGRRARRRPRYSSGSSSPRASTAKRS